MSEKKCAFCASLETYQYADELWNEKQPEKVYHEYKVALVRRSWTKEKHKRHAGRTTDYRHMGIGYDLNFCPECGRKLKD